jgi:hypothetical protein
MESCYRGQHRQVLGGASETTKIPDSSDSHSPKAGALRMPARHTNCTTECLGWHCYSWSVFLLLLRPLYGPWTPTGSNVNRGAAGTWAPVQCLSVTAGGNAHKCRLGTGPLAPGGRLTRAQSLVHTTQPSLPHQRPLPVRHKGTPLHSDIKEAGLVATTVAMP